MKNYKFKSKLNKDHKTLYVFKCTNQMIHNKQSYIKSITLERNCYECSKKDFKKEALKLFIGNKCTKKGYIRGKIVDKLS